MSEKNYECIKVEKRSTKNGSTICFIGLNRPEKANALSIKMLEELKDVLTVTKEEQKNGEKIRALVLHSYGKHFCAGADLSWTKFKENEIFNDPGSDYNRASTILFDILNKLSSFPTPTIAVCKGASYGGGVGLARVCDTVIADKEAVFCLSEARVGLVPAVILPFLRKHLSYSTLTNMVCRSLIIKEKLAMVSGLVDVLVEESKIEDTLNQVINELLAVSYNSQIIFKKYLRSIEGIVKIDTSIKDLSLYTLANARQTPEARQGVDAFLEKKEACWKDKYEPKQ
jgi:methylglutaconyl-CoA hydratase